MSFQPANPEQKKILRAFCDEEFKHQIAYLSEKYGLSEYNPHFSLNFRTNAVASYGGELTDGEPFISLIALEICAHVGTVSKYGYEEYDFLKKKEGIGDGWANWKQYMAWIMAHELAHTLVEIDRFRELVEKHYLRDVANDRRGHGKLWQAIYRDLRTGFCAEERYPVEEIDFSKFVWHTSKTIKGVQHITFYRGGKEIGWYLRSKKHIYKSNRKFTKKTPTQYQNPAEIRKRLVTV
jgi:hypothetical protein